MSHSSKTGDKSSLCVKSQWGCWTAAKRRTLTVMTASTHCTERCQCVSYERVSDLRLLFSLTSQHSGTHMYQHSTAVHICTNTAQRYTYVPTQHSGTHMYQHSIAEHICTNCCTTKKLFIWKNGLNVAPLEDSSKLYFLLPDTSNETGNARIVEA